MSDPNRCCGFGGVTMQSEKYHLAKLAGLPKAEMIKNTEAKVWSFYQINTITTNEKNFDEDGWHFKPKISDLVFAKIFDDKSVVIPNNFGVLLTKDNIDVHLENLKEQIQSYDLDKNISYERR